MHLRFPTSPLGAGVRDRRSLERFARLVLRHRRLVIAAWLAAAVAGVFSASTAANRFDEQFTVPGGQAADANNRSVERFGSGQVPPVVAVITAPGDVTKLPGLERGIAAAAAEIPGSRTSSLLSGGGDAYVSADRHTTFVNIYPPGYQEFEPPLEQYAAAGAALRAALPAGATVRLTGRDLLYAAGGATAGGPGVLVEALIGFAGALLILLLVFGTLPAVAMPLAVALASILTTFNFVLAMTALTEVSIVVEYLVIFIGLGLAIDYSLLVIFRFREELRRGLPVEDALVETVTHAGRAVLISGSTVAVGLISLIVVPVPFISSMGIGGMLIPAVSVVAALTLVPACLSLLGHGIDRVPLLPRRLRALGEGDSGFWYRWSGVVLRRPVLVALAGAAIVGALLVPAFQLNAGEAQAQDYPGKGEAISGREALAAAGISAGVMKPFVVLVEGDASPRVLGGLVGRLERTPGIVGAAAPPAWRRGDLALVEAFPAVDGDAPSGRPTIARLRHDVLPAAESDAGGAVRMTLGGHGAENRDFVAIVYGRFPYVLAFVLAVTFVLLARAFRSLLLALKAMVVNLISLGAAFGVVVLVFQWGYGSEALFDTASTDIVISWIPVMLFAFLFGLSMDYEVFMLARIREAYDETGDTREAVRLGLSRTGKLVTSAAAVLMCAFFALATEPTVDVKQFGVAAAAGIILDATVIRATLVPALIVLLGRWNWWFPAPAAKLLLTESRRAAEGAPA